jgi:hypothetical protein
MLSVIISSRYSYATMLLVQQLLNYISILPGPLVLGINLFSFLNYQYIGTELSHDVLNPAHVPL